MNQKNIILVLVAIVVILGAVTLLSKKSSDRTSLPENQTQPSAVSTSTTPTSASVSTTTKPVASAPKAVDPSVMKDAAWAVVQKFLAVSDKHDLPGVTATRYSLSEECKNPAMERECFKLMDYAHDVLKPLKKEDFTEVWFDSKQIVLSTNFRISSTTHTLGAGKSYLYFAYATGTLKLAGALPNFGESIERKDRENDTKYIIDLFARLTDADRDGIFDKYENCKTGQLSINCSPTSPAKRDTDGDGWWDGTELFIK